MGYLEAGGHRLHFDWATGFARANETVVYLHDGLGSTGAWIGHAVGSVTRMPLGALNTASPASRAPSSWYRATRTSSVRPRRSAPLPSTCGRPPRGWCLELGTPRTSNVAAHSSAGPPPSSGNSHSGSAPTHPELLTWFPCQTSILQCPPTGPTPAVGPPRSSGCSSASSSPTSPSSSPSSSSVFAVAP